MSTPRSSGDVALPKSICFLITKGELVKLPLPLIWDGVLPARARKF